MPAMPLPGQHLLDRRLQLLARCEVERIELIRRSHDVQSLLGAIDGAVHVAQGVRRHPGVALGALAAVLLIVRPQRLRRLIGHLLSASRTLQLVLPVMQGLRQRL